MENCNFYFLSFFFWYTLCVDQERKTTNIEIKSNRQVYFKNNSEISERSKFSGTYTFIISDIQVH